MVSGTVTCSCATPHFRLVGVNSVQEYSPDGVLRECRACPDELVSSVDRATVTAGDAAGDLPGPPGEAGVPCGGRDAGATPFAEGVTTGGQRSRTRVTHARTGWKPRSRDRQAGSTRSVRARPGKPVRDGTRGRVRTETRPNRGGDGNRTRVQGFAGPCLNHSATPPRKLFQRPNDRAEGPPWIPRAVGLAPTAFGVSERTTGFEPATLTLAR